MYCPNRRFIQLKGSYFSDLVFSVDVRRFVCFNGSDVHMQVRVNINHMKHVVLLILYKRVYHLIIFFVYLAKLCWWNELQMFRPMFSSPQVISAHLQTCIFGKSRFAPPCFTVGFFAPPPIIFLFFCGSRFWNKKNIC